ncbi:geranylgeranylglyceryl/heptaprenylglyceryl phosphate synthase [Paenibacillus polymyxa]|uniref:hypothetical protein n=1 Tax=Paenibacillus polymyxa TaxID=1406 RepID=UPI0008FBAF59|nr:hypothetical protein [Paenibacillus polymyxa]APB77355.1 geranylgeranylglyceryl/heptaprenylglyceryl phosphate synthase [Paenibacillus polymyxa]
MFGIKRKVPNNTSIYTINKALLSSGCSDLIVCNKLGISKKELEDIKDDSSCLTIEQAHTISYLCGIPVDFIYFGKEESPDMK